MSQSSSIGGISAAVLLPDDASDVPLLHRRIAMDLETFEHLLDKRFASLEMKLLEKLISIERICRCAMNDCTSTHTNLYSQTFVSLPSSEMTIEQRLVNDFRNRNVDQLSLDQAKVCLDGQTYTHVRGVLYWSDYPGGISKSVRDSGDINTEDMSCFRFSHSGIWKEISLEGIPQQVSGQQHDVLVVTGFQGIRLIVDWNVRKLSEVQRGNAVLLVRL